MCTILFAYKEHFKYDLIVAANRDEFLKRPTSQAAFWDESDHLLAGRDLEKGGTWMGVTKDGRFSGLTNYRSGTEEAKDKRSRGHLVANYLKGNEEVDRYLARVSKEGNNYPQFNLLAGTVDSLYYYTNVTNETRKIEAGVHGLSNALLNSNWPKVTDGKRQMSEIIKNNDGNMIDELFTMLANNKKYRDELLPNSGVPLQLERKLSSLYIDGPDYGTKSSTVILISKDEIIFKERTFTENNFCEKEYKIKY